MELYLVFISDGIILEIKWNKGNPCTAHVNKELTIEYSPSSLF